MKILGLIIFAGWLLWTPPVFAEPSSAEKKQCTPCHRFSLDDPPEQHKAPDLFYAGNKFQEKWLLEFLQNPSVIRKAGFLTDPGFLKGQPTMAHPHASLSERAAREMTGYLLSLKLPDLPSGQVDSEPLSKGRRVKVKIMFERNFGCTACHEGINLAGKPRGGISGPSLATAGDRLQPDWIFNWLKTPGKFLDRGRMPVFDLDHDTAVQITKYLMTLNKEKLK